MEERARRIVDTAIELAELGGFEAVRLRDVADKASVALGTVYKRFRGKEDILIAALEREMETFDMMIRTYPIPGDRPVDRVAQFFALATTALCAKPNFARAVLKALSSGDPSLTERVTRFHTSVGTLINLTIAGEGNTPPSDQRIAFLLQQIWFAQLVGWMGGIANEDSLVEHMRYASQLLVPMVVEAH
jgi:TetR/AcrR family transcriptional regulator, cholesterol catabolism regulator